MRKAVIGLDLQVEQGTPWEGWEGASLLEVKLNDLTETGPSQISPVEKEEPCAFAFLLESSGCIIGNEASNKAKVQEQ